MRNTSLSRKAARENSWGRASGCTQEINLFPRLPGRGTVVGIALGVGAGEGASPLPAEAGPGARCTRAGEPPCRQTGDVCMEN
ncbi:protein of unknown function [Methanoculleus bourgensis]|uniref:Uncharacterized protein n=1 Tax=Methanoculleus bourgensis TaxID=83986 RepID=A0A0X3BJR6_9EURY|nr:protein of unknown function [Methanoculleus bourgensis]